MFIDDGVEGLPVGRDGKRSNTGDVVCDANIGHRPTFGETRPTIETHLLDFDGNVYEREMRVELLERLRGEQRFSGPDELVDQIKRDIDDARAFFKRA